MPRYFYIAKSFKGEEKSGLMEAKDEHQLARILHQQGYVLISANLEGKKISQKRELIIPFLSRVSLKEKIFFTKNLRVMVSAGLSLPKILRILADQTKNKKFQKVLNEIAQEITKGKTFFQSLSKYPNIFSEFFISMIKIGEETGTLEEVLSVLTFQMEREQELKSKIRGALIYPAVIIGAMIIIGILMLIVVVPKLAETFEALKIPLPLTTRIVIGIGNFFAQFWYLLPLILILVGLFLKIILKTKKGKKFFDAIFLKIPILSPLIKKANSAHFVRSLSSLISAGIPLVRALEIIATTQKNIYFQEASQEAIEKIKKGEKLAQALKPHEKIYPLGVIQMIEVGEETGETSEILSKLAEFYETEVTNTTKNLTSVIEPILMLLIGSIVGFFAVSMIQPIYSMLGKM